MTNYKLFLPLHLLSSIEGVDPLAEKESYLRLDRRDGEEGECEDGDCDPL